MQTSESAGIEIVSQHFISIVERQDIKLIALLLKIQVWDIREAGS